jgi:glycosyltransferase involved in cell wall biosynthesis
VVFQHLSALHARGHQVELWSLDAPPDWFDLGDVPVRQFSDYDALVEALEDVPAIKVATWWNTAAPVWRASVRHGIPVYFVQDIETSYYPEHPEVHGAILASYREEFSFLTTSAWNRQRLRDEGRAATVIPPGLDDKHLQPVDIRRRAGVVLALGRRNPLKNFALTRSAWEALPDPRPELWLFGGEPELADAAGIRYLERPSDERVRELLHEAGVFVQTSIHEGFCLPILEAMAAGTPVVCTDADGNRDFCVQDSNCLMPAATTSAVAEAIARVLSDPTLRQRLIEGGLATARRYAWSTRADDLDAFMRRLAQESGGASTG